MGSNMMAQAVPLLALISDYFHGMEGFAAIDSGQVMVAEEDGEVTSVTGRQVLLRTASGVKIYNLRKYQRSNQSTCLDQRPAVVKGQKVKKGHILADSSSTVQGNLALGQNVVVAFVSWEGGNFEDAILISENWFRMINLHRFI